MAEVISPPSLAPALTDTMSVSSFGFNPSTPAAPGMITRKEWIVPPRPKPGRKPAQDTPPTKRKAQNRAAQRAFRERRAAKVGELEVNIKEIETEYEKSQEGLRARIGRLEAEAEVYRQQLLAWQRKNESLSRELELERESRLAAEAELRHRGATDVEGSAMAVVPLPHGHRSGLPVTQAGTVASEPQQFSNSISDLMGCGDCTIDTRCECVEQAINLSALTIPDNRNILNPIIKRPPSPAKPGHRKRSKSQHAPELAESSLETDFTALYASIKPTLPTEASSWPTPIVQTSASPNDDCGFCEDGSPCICAELDVSHSRNRIKSFDNPSVPSCIDEGTRLPPILSQYTPPSSDDSAEAYQSHGSRCHNNTTRPIDRNAIHPPQTTHGPASPTGSSFPLLSGSKSTNFNSCINGPGTCMQCQQDSNSTFFCKSLAAIRTSQTINSVPLDRRSSTSGCCQGQPGDAASCCRNSSTQPPSSNPPHHPTTRAQAPRSPPDLVKTARNEMSPSRLARSLLDLASTAEMGTTATPFLSCADTYTTLSRHPAYGKATTELATWMGKLKTNPPQVTHRRDCDSTSAAARDTPNIRRNDDTTPSIECEEATERSGAHVAMEVEAASVLGVLRLFDRRFGKGDGRSG